jgi:hypothetical protein
MYKIADQTTTFDDLDTAYAALHFEVQEQTKKNRFIGLPAKQARMFAEEVCYLERCDEVGNWVPF